MMGNATAPHHRALRLDFISITQLILLLVQALIAVSGWFTFPRVKFEQLWLLDAGTWFAIGSTIVSALLVVAGVFIPGWKMMLLRLLMLLLHAGLALLTLYVCIGTIVGRC